MNGLDPSSSTLDAAVVLNRAILDAGIGELLSSSILGGGGFCYNSWALFAAFVATGLSLWRIRSYYSSDGQYYSQCNVEELGSSLKKTADDHCNDYDWVEETPRVSESSTTPETTPLRETNLIGGGGLQDRTKKGKFATYFCGEERESVVAAYEDDEEEEEEEKGCDYTNTAAVVATWKVDGYERIMADNDVISNSRPSAPVVGGGGVDVGMETTMRWFYEYQDLGELNGRVVRLWDVSMRKPRRSSINSLVCC